MKPNKDETKRRLSQLIIYYKKVKRENEKLKSQNEIFFSNFKINKI